MRRLLSGLAGFFFFISTSAQTGDFITRGRIEYEIKINQKRIMDDYRKDPRMENLISSLPDFDISYYNLTFSRTASLYSPGKASSSQRADRGSLYIENGKDAIVAKRKMSDKIYVYQDSLKHIKWRIMNETRKIAGFECRKAIGRIADTMYVVAFYSLEIMPQSGPELFTGLPGMILGIAVPQMNTTWFATKVELANIDESTIQPPSPGKGKMYNPTELSTIILKNNTGMWPKDYTASKIRSAYFDGFVIW